MFYDFLGIDYDSILGEEEEEIFYFMSFNYDVLFFFEEFVLFVDMFGVKLFGNLL